MNTQFEKITCTTHTCGSNLTNLIQKKQKIEALQNGVENEDSRNDNGTEMALKVWLLVCKLAENSGHPKTPWQILK